MISPLNEFRQKRLRRTSPRGFAIEHVTATRREQLVDWVSGACLLVRRADAEAAGLLDERFFLYTEDVDFCHAVRAARRTVLFTPAAEIMHLRGRSRAHSRRRAARPTGAATWRSTKSTTPGRCCRCCAGISAGRENCEPGRHCERPAL